MLHRVKGYWVWIDQSGAHIVALRHLIGENKFSAMEIRNDIMKGKLIIGDYDTKELIESLGSIHVNVDEIDHYLDYKNEETNRKHFEKLMNQIESFSSRMTIMEEMILQQYKMMKDFMNATNRNSRVELKEVAKIFQNRYKLGTIRNMISKNKVRQGEFWISNLKIMEYDLVFRKHVKSKKWFADHIDYILEREKTYNYDFQQKLSNLHKKADKFILNSKTGKNE